jgi:hypothetical protein
MRKRIVRVSPIQAGKVLAVLYGIISVPFALIMFVIGLSKGQAGPSLLLVLAIPIIYLVFGFIFTVIGAWLYNLVAKWTGGIEFESQEQLGP